MSIGKILRDGNRPPSTVDVTTTRDSATINVSTTNDMVWLRNVLSRFGFPDGTIDLMEQTRAVDGMQQAEGDGVTARWTYYPDDGLSIVVQRSS